MAAYICPMRIPILALLGALVLTSCGSVVNEQIVRARVNAPSAPPLPLLPVDESERIVVQAGFAQRIGAYPSGRPLTDSGGSDLQLNFDPQSVGGIFIVHYNAFWWGFELSNDRTSMLLGLNVQKENWKCLGYFGLGSTSFHQDLVLLQQRQPDLFSTKDTLVPFSGSASNTTTSAGFSAMFTNAKVQPFLAFRFLGGPTVDGSSPSYPAAVNEFSLSQALVYAGVRGDIAPRLHILAGAGWRTFTGGLIHGSDWNAYLGASVDLGVAAIATGRPENAPPEPLDMTPQIVPSNRTPSSVAPVGP